MIAAATNTAKPGVYDAMPRAVYESLVDERGQRLANYSMLKLFSQPPAKAKQFMDFPPPPSDALTIGDAVHAAILEPSRFEQEYARGIKVDRRTKAGKQAWEAFEAENANKLALTEDDYVTCEAMRDAIWNDGIAKAILQAPGKVERSFVWRDQSGQWCKGRCDKMSRWDGWTVVIDLKTARSAAPDDFSRDIAKYGYDVQAAFYLDGLSTLHPAQRRWLWIVIEKEPPYLFAIYEPEERLLQQGRRKYAGYLDTYKRCVESGVWPGYENGVVPIDVPKWSRDVPAGMGDETF